LNLNQKFGLRANLKENLRVLITGANGFIGRNLCLKLKELGKYQIEEFLRGDSVASLPDIIKGVDIVVHLAGENRPANPKDYEITNIDLTRALCNAIKASGKDVPIIFTSSIQANLENPYGRSKKLAEKLIQDLSRSSVIFRLPGVFGKWCKPNYNSVVATFCHHIANGLPISINDPSTILTLIYIDDLIKELIAAIDRPQIGSRYGSVEPVYTITLGELAEQLSRFKNSRETMVTEKVGSGLVRALYSTYISYIPPTQFSYEVLSHRDERGIFVEMLKTIDAGQFSYFTALPGVTRGGHYHHTKTEKFLVIRGNARFGFRHILTNEKYEICTSGNAPRIVETVPGWTHDITNVGESELIVMLWANEIFDRDHPDTISSKV
jgi:UDP-2-acetamido-2,6-beta-L-arabino-hexul-4-ose reductase